MSVFNDLISAGWTLQCWQDRYGKGVWAVMAPNYFQSHDIQDVLEGSDAESLNLGFYLQEQERLPIVNRKDLDLALLALGSKLLKISDSEAWRKEVFDAFEKIRETDWNKNTPSEDEEQRG